VSALREAAPNETQRDFLTRLAVEQVEFYGELDEHYARQMLSTIRTHSINRRESNLRSELSRLGSGSQVEEQQRVLTELMALQQEKRAFQDELADGM
ncbi:DNA primase, partial [Nocardiopsis tropica]|nr:DNA primase [Nocardiopsis tropica]